VLPEDSAQFASHKIRFPVRYPDDVSYRLDAHLSKVPAVRTTCHTVRTPICLKHHPSGPSPVSRSFKLIQLASVQTFQQHIQMTLSVRQASGFLSKAQLWEDRCNRPDDVDFRSDALIHKASIAIQIQTSGRRSSWSGRACIKSTIWMIIPCSGRVKIRYENCVHQINRSDNHPLVRTRETSILKLLAVEVRPSGR